MTSEAKSCKVAVLFQRYPSVAFYPIDGGRMYKINLWSFYSLAVDIHPLTKITNTDTIGSVYQVLGDAEVGLALFYGEREEPLEICQSELKNLLDTIIFTGNYYKKDPDKQLGFGLAARIVRHAKEFESALKKQFEFFDTYYVRRKGAFDTTALIDRAEEVILNRQVKNRLPEQTIYDLKQAGKCIAFEIPNAAGFHIIRAIEAVIRLYYEKEIGAIPKPKDRNWGAYIKNLRSAKANEKILTSLDSIREHYRNPILHPEERLEFDDAFNLFNLSITVITAMIKEILAKEAANENQNAESGGG